jgi:NAD(P)-dependent dehydrogenase (short-subunit alcohol dehydrogenase family)
MPYCIVGGTRGTGLQMVQQLVERGAPVRCVVRDPVNRLPPWTRRPLSRAGRFDRSDRDGRNREAQAMDIEKHHSFTSPGA